MEDKEEMENWLISLKQRIEVPFEQDIAYAVQRACNEISDHLTSDRINWEQRRYEVARTMLPTMFELAMNEKKEMNGPGFILPKSICKAAISYADELINQLKPKGGFQD
jgi:hypothetical protein